MQINRIVPFFRAQEVLAIGEKHVLHTRLEDNRAHRALLASSIPSPTAVRSVIE
jgi:hypothetical protein